jgi:hypothetical protein
MLKLGYMSSDTGSPFTGFLIRHNIARDQKTAQQLLIGILLVSVMLTVWIDWPHHAPVLRQTVPPGMAGAPQAPAEKAATR